jgi:hypothetical protein
LNDTKADVTEWADDAKNTIFLLYEAKRTCEEIPRSGKIKNECKLFKL